MRIYDTIVKKRDGFELNTEEIKVTVEKYVKGDIPDYQISALLMAIFFKGMTFRETLDLTMSMVDSGEKYDLSALAFPSVDKHSTGGVGDKISIPLVPMVTSFDVIVPMMSGRGLGHTGGTLDKLESIPGFRVEIDKDTFFELLRKNKTAMIGQTYNIAPADKKLYALRDVTGTVDSIPLITASIMSKKIAEGASSLVFDVKWGRGAFMKTEKDASQLSEYLLKVSSIAGIKADHIISDMNSPIGRTIGNRLEMIESIEVLKGEGPEDTMKLTETLAAKMLVITGIFKTEYTALEEIKKRYSTGIYLERFKKIIELQGGDPGIIDDHNKMRPSSRIFELTFEENGRITSLDALDLGLAALICGAGREKKEDNIDHSCGIEILKRTGDIFQKNEPVLLVHYNDESRLNRSLELIRRGVKFELS